MLPDQIKNKTVALAVACAASGYGVHPDAIVAGGRGITQVVWARQTAIYLAAKTGIAVAAIGAEFERSESGIIEAVRAVESRLTVPNWDKEWCPAHARSVASFNAEKAGVLS